MKKNKKKQTTKKEWKSDCKRYKTCNRDEKYQGRCNSVCCKGYKPKKK